MKKWDEQIKCIFPNNKCICTSNMHVIHYDLLQECFFSTQVQIFKVPICLVEILRNSCSASKYKWIQKNGSNSYFSHPIQKLLHWYVERFLKWETQKWYKDGHKVKWQKYKHVKWGIKKWGNRKKENKLCWKRTKKATEKTILPKTEL